MNKATIRRRFMTSHATPLYFTLSAAADGSTISLNKSSSPADCPMQVSINGAKFVDYTFGDVITLDTGDDVKWRRKKGHDTTTLSDKNGSYRFDATGSWMASGYVTTLLKWNGDVSEISAGCFHHLLYSAGGLVVDLELPDSVQFIGSSAFEHCYGLKTLQIPDGCLVSLDSTFHHCESLQTIRIPALISDGYKRYAFAYDSQIDNIYLGGSNTNTLGTSFSFYQCYNLKNVHYPDIDTLCGNYWEQVWVYCVGPFDASRQGHVYIEDTEVTDLVIPEGKTEILRGCFRYVVGFVSATIPSTMQTMGLEVFRGCRNLAWVKCLATTPPTIARDVFTETNDCPIYVPYSADHSILAAYQSASGWSDYAARILELDENGNIPT